MTTDLMIEIRFLSDWGVGTGAGRGGDVDKVIAKDRFGLPMIPAKTLTGMLRDACEEAAYALDSGFVGPWNDWLGWLFGDQPSLKGRVRQPVPAALSIRPATLGAASQAAAANPRFAQAAVVIRPGVAIDPTTGVARDDTLRMEERALSGLTATAPATVNAASLPREARVLLVCGARLLQHIGGKRRRGAGRCEVTVRQTNVVLTAEAADFDDPAPVDTLPQALWVAAPSSEQHMLTRSFEITCVTPVVASAGVKGNLVETLDYIPGSLLFPLVARALGGDVSALIASGRIRVSDATPAPNGRRLTPVPLNVRKPKGAASAQLRDALLDDLSGAVRYVPVKNGWLDPTVALTAASIHGQELTERAHAVIEDVAQRPNEDSGGLFVQQAIPAGARLRFGVDLPEDVPLTLAGQHAVGRSKKDDYGLIDVREVTDPPEATSSDASSRIVVYLESDTLLLDDKLDATTDATTLADVVAGSLGLTRVGVVEAFHATRRHESWSARWGLPRPSLVAIKAGTVVRFDVDESHQIGTAMTIGQRCAEGFGRVWINPPLLLGKGTHAPATGTTDHDGEPVAADANMALIAASRVGRGLLEAVAGVDVEAMATQLGFGQLSNSQLGLLRQLALSAASNGIQLRGDLGKGTLTPSLRDLLADAKNVGPLLELDSEADMLLARRLLLVHCIRHARKTKEDLA